MHCQVHKPAALHVSLLQHTAKVHKQFRSSKSLFLASTDLPFLNPRVLSGMKRRLNQDGRSFECTYFINLSRDKRKRLPVVNA